MRIAMRLLPLFALLAMPLTVEPAIACTCVANEVPAEANLAEAVVIGEVIEVQSDSERGGYVAVMEVSRAFTGSPEGLIAVRSGDPAGGCGVFDEGANGDWYLLALNEEEGMYGAGTCGGYAMLGGSGGPTYVASLKLADFSGWLFGIELIALAGAGLAAGWLSGAGTYLARPRQTPT